MSRTVKDSGLRADFPVSNITPRRMTGVRSGVNRIGQPAASTRVPGAVPGQRSFASSTPSPSESLKRWHPTSSTSAPGGVLGHLSSPSGTPSLSESSGQPAWSTTAPAGVPGHWSRPSSTPSPSASAGQPLASTRAPAGVPGHWSRPSSTPSPSASAGQPLALTCAPAGVPGHWSSPSYTPSASESVGHPGAAVSRSRRGAAGRRLGALAARVEPCADGGAEEGPQPTAAADLGGQVEDRVVTRERSERPELELVRALCGEAGAPARERYS